MLNQQLSCRTTFECGYVIADLDAPFLNSFNAHCYKLDVTISYDSEHIITFQKFHQLLDSAVPDQCYIVNKNETKELISRVNTSMIQSGVKVIYMDGDIRAETLLTYIVNYLQSTFNYYKFDVEIVEAKLYETANSMVKYSK